MVLAELQIAFSPHPFLSLCYFKDFERQLQLFEEVSMINLGYYLEVVLSYVPCEAFKELARFWIYVVQKNRFVKLLGLW